MNAIRGAGVLEPRRGKFRVTCRKHQLNVPVMQVPLHREAYICAIAMLGLISSRGV